MVENAEIDTKFRQLVNDDCNRAVQLLIDKYQQISKRDRFEYCRHDVNEYRNCGSNVLTWLFDKFDSMTFYDVISRVDVITNVDDLIEFIDDDWVDLFDDDDVNRRNFTKYIKRLDYNRQYRAGAYSLYRIGDNCWVVIYDIDPLDRDNEYCAARDRVYKLFDDWL